MFQLKMKDKFQVLIPDYNKRRRLYDPILEQNKLPFSFVTESRDDLSDIDICLISHEFHFNGKINIDLAKRYSIPTLLLMDGIIEWRNNWEYPAIRDPLRGMPLYQLISSDKVACIGYNQVRILDYWGNLGKCELVGYPPLQETVNSRKLFRVPFSNPDEVNFLILTATTPYFNETQEKKVHSSLRDIKIWFDANPTISNKTVNCEWRVSKKIKDEEIISLNNDFSSEPLEKAIERADIVISTPSTAFLSSFILKRPTIKLDYTNSPEYFLCAWNISSKDQLESQILDAATPSAEKMFFQEGVLKDNLYTAQNSISRLYELMEKMIVFSREKKPLSQILLKDDYAGYISKGIDFRKLYPDYEVFKLQNDNYMQSLIGQQRVAIDQLKQEIKMLKNEISEIPEKVNNPEWLRKKVTVKNLIKTGYKKIILRNKI